MSRGGGKKGAEAGWGSAEKRGESIVILNQKYSGIKPKRGHKKKLQLARVRLLPVEQYFDYSGLECENP